MLKEYYVYILSNYKYGALYIGVTNDLIRRVFEHKRGLVDGFTKKYYIMNLVYFEITSDIKSAIRREKQLKDRERSWKIALIEKNNPHWEEIVLW